MRVVEVNTKELLNEFVKLPYKLHRTHKLWVPPLISDERLYFDRGRNIAFKKNQAILLVAFQDNECVGRVMGIINPEHNRKEGTNSARFGYLECRNEIDTFNGLMDAVEKWAKRSGMDRIVGPMGFSDQDPEGFIIEGEDLEPTIATYYNYGYIPAMLESRGYGKEVDYVVYLIDLGHELDVTYEKLFRRFVDRTSLKLHTFTRKRELRPFVKPIMELMNETFRNLYGYSELSHEEIDFVVKRFWPLVDPRFVFAAKQDSSLVGFMIGIPNLNDGFRKCKGRLFPFGILKLIVAARKSRQLDLLIA
ncbi:MAG TPA: hypothetical protein PL001_10655, partial [Candidatus Kryptobacter bacterium]|nr:hypothetical protein [Candidatus Kryptobacter bacterium]